MTRLSLVAGTNERILASRGSDVKNNFGDIEKWQISKLASFPKRLSREFGKSLV
jgi:hypothetical protein